MYSWKVMGPLKYVVKINCWICLKFLPTFKTKLNKCLIEIVDKLYPSSISDSTQSKNCQVRNKNLFNMEMQNRRADEDIISSQSSSKSLIFQANEDVRSGSGSNSQDEDQISGCNLS